jgi:hypothetical protein
VRSIMRCGSRSSSIGTIFIVAGAVQILRISVL